MSFNSVEHKSTTSLYSLIRKVSSYMIIERSIVPIVNFLITVFIIRKLTVNDFGIYNVLLAIMGYVSLASSFGIPTLFQRFIPEFYQKKQIGNLSRLVGQGLLWILLLSAGILLIMVVFSNQIGNFFKFTEAMQYLTIFSIAIIFHLESGLLSIVLTSIFYHKKYVIAQILYVFFRGGLLYYLLSAGKGLVGLLITESIAFGFLCFLQLFFYRRYISAHSAQEKAEFPIKRLLRFGGLSYLNDVGAQILAVSTDFFIISAFLGPVAVGVYAFANQIMKATSHILPHYVLTNVIRPTFFTQFAKHNDVGQLNKTFNFLLKIIAFFEFPLVMGIIVLGDKLIIYIFDPKYLGSLNILWIVAAFTALNSFLFPLGLVTQAIERVEINLYSKIFAVYNLILDLVVVKPYGITGIALVTGSAVFFKNLFMFLFTRRYTPLTLCWQNLLLIMLNSCLMGGVLFLLRSFITSVYSFFVIVILGILIYCTVAYFNKAFSTSERNVINKILPKPLFVF